MLMHVLVRTLDRHEPIADRNPSLKPSHRTCLRVAGLQEHATTPGDSTFKCLASQQTDWNANYKKKHLKPFWFFFLSRFQETCTKYGRAMTLLWFCRESGDSAIFSVPHVEAFSSAFCQIRSSPKLKILREKHFVTPPFLSDPRIPGPIYGSKNLKLSPRPCWNLMWLDVALAYEITTQYQLMMSIGQF